MGTLNFEGKPFVSMVPFAIDPLAACLIIHVWVAIQLTLENRAARPAGYGIDFTNRATHASRVMARTGLVVLAFLVYHLLDFTLRVQHPEWGAYS